MGTCQPEHADYFEPESGTESKIMNLRRGTPSDVPLAPPGAFAQALTVALFLVVVVAFVAAAWVRG